MKLVLEEYLQSMKEKDELDFLLCDLLMLDGYIVNTRPQRGERQFGVDIAARKKDEIYLFVIKQKNIDRKSWDSSPDGVRASFNEIIDFYIPKNLVLNGKVKAIHVVLTTNGNVASTVIPNYNGFTSNHTDTMGISLKFDIWNITTLVNLCEKVAFNEVLFPSDIQSLLRKALYYIDEPDFRNTYFEKIVDYYMKRFEEFGNNDKKLKKVLTSFYTCIALINKWIRETKQYKKSIDLIEYSLISFWRYVCKTEKHENKDIVKYLKLLFDLYEKNNISFFDEVKQICDVDNGLRSINIIESRFITLEVASRISIFGIYLLEKKDENKKKVSEVYDVLIRLLDNNPSYRYPPYDDNIIELSFIYLFLKEMDIQRSKNFLWILFGGISENYRANKIIPSPSDDYEEVLSIYFRRIHSKYDASILFGTLLEWTCCAGMEDLFSEIECFIKSEFKEMICQTWQISKTEEIDFFSHGASFLIGTGLPFYLHDDLSEFRRILDSLDFNVDFNNFKSNRHSLSSILLINSRYFHFPVLPQFWRDGSKV